MQTARMVQGVVLMMIVAMALSCAASKEYSSKLFTPRIPVVKDSQQIAKRFLLIDSAEVDTKDWVTTDIIMGRETDSKTLALDKLAKVFPANPLVLDSSTKKGQAKTIPEIGAIVKTVPAETEPVAKNIIPGEIRTKRVRESEQ